MKANLSFLLILLLFQFGAFSQNIIHYNTANTSSTICNSHCRAVAIDENDNAWIATDGGLSKFDGDHWETFTKENGLETNKLVDVLIDKQNTPWVAQTFGLSYGGDSGWVNIPGEGEIFSSTIKKITYDKFGNIWLGTSSKTHCFDGENWTTIDHRNGTGLNGLTDLVIDTTGTAWAITQRGLITLTNGVWEIVNNDDLNNSSIFLHSLEVDANNNLWIGTGSGLYKYDHETVKKFTTANGLAHNYVYKIHIDSYGNIWMKTANGFVKYDGSVFTTISLPDNIDASDIQDINSDSKGGIHLATIKGYASYYNNQWKVYKADGLLGNTIRGIAGTPEGDIWISTSKGINKLSGNSFEGFTSFPNMSSYSANTVMCARNGDIWSGIYIAGNGGGGGVCRYNGSTWKTYNQNNSNLTGGIAVWLIYEDRDGNFWFGGDRAYLCKYDGASWNKYEFENAPRDIASDANNVVWVAAGRDIYTYDGASWNTITDELFDDLTYFNSVAIDSFNTPWLGANNGLFHYTGTKWEKFTTAEGLPENFVQNLTVDYAGNLWMEAGGLIKYDYDTFTHYDTDDSAFYSGINIITTAIDGAIWVGTDDGIYSLSFGDVWLSLSESNLQFDNVPAGEQTIEISSNTDWKVTTHCDWITCSEKSGANNGSITISCNENTSGKQRKSDVYVRSKSSSMNKLTIIQGETSSKEQSEQLSKGYVYLNKQTLQLHINYPHFKKAELFDGNGMLVAVTEQNNIDVSGLVQGVYLIRINAENGAMETHKIVR